MSEASRFSPDVRAFRRALEPGCGSCPDAAGALEDIARFRDALGDPLGAHARASAPDSSLRARLVARPEAVLAAGPGRAELRLAADTVSVAVALSDELGINEGDAALLLRDARGLLVRGDGSDVVGAAKDVYYSRRRELLLFLQELLRVHLLSGSVATEEDASFHDSLIRERDALFVECNLFENIVTRITAGLPSLAAPSASNPRPAPPNKVDALVGDEAVLLAECLFLLSYSVQVSSAEALAVRELLKKAVALVASIVGEEEAVWRRQNHTAAGHPHSFPGHVSSTVSRTVDENATSSSMPSAVGSRAQTLRNLIFLSWICCIDRSRYSDLYNPRTGVSDVNSLLKDLVFVKRTAGLPALSPEALDDPSVEIAGVDPVIAAAELGGAVFRMAVAEPDKDEAILTVLRTCAYAQALEFLSGDLADWIESGGGSLLPDSNLYADVFEDFAFDLSEAPDFAAVLFRYTQDEVMHAASAVAASSYGNSNPDVLPHVSLPGSSPGGLFGSAVGRRSSPSRLSGGKPPKPPLPGRSPYGTPGPGSQDHGATGRSMRPPPGPNHGGTVGGTVGSASEQGGGASPKNLVALLGNVVARAMKLAPGKLVCDSVSGGLRYWAGVGAETLGMINRMGECVMDMYDAAFRNPEADSPYAEAFNGALLSFIELLSMTAIPGGNTPHAASSLRFLCHSGHSVVSMDRALLALNHHYDVFSSPGHGSHIHVSEVDTSCLIGLLEVIAHCAESLQPQGGMGPIAGRHATDMAPRVAALALLDVPFKLRASLVRTLMVFGDIRPSLMFLEDVTKNKLAKLRQTIRGQEAEMGVYDATVSVLELATLSCGWASDDYPSYAVHHVALFAVDEVVAHWSQRKYASDFERWRVMRCASELLLAIISKERSDGGEFLVAHNVMSRLLCPAPGTGAASPALRAFLACAGLRRTSDDGRSRTLGGANSTAVPGNGTGAGVFQCEGRESLSHAASVGDGRALREMELASAACARVLTFTLSLSPNQFSTHSMVTARASDLLLSEPKALVAAGSLVFAADECTTKPSPFRLGYSSSTCAAVLEMLASAASQSTLICKLLTRSDEPAASARFRCSIADVIASYSVTNVIGRAEDLLSGDVTSKRDNALSSDSGSVDKDTALQKAYPDRPRMHSALHLVEACLGLDGGGKPGLFLLGLVMDVGDRLQNAQYGVLSALMELVSGIGHGASSRVDDRSRATAAIFLERLAGNTTATTSSAVLEFIRSVGSRRPAVEAQSRQVITQEGMSWSFGDVLLSRMLEFFGTVGPSGPSAEAVDWGSLGELAGACMKLSALLVRQFPGEEQDCVSMAEQPGVSSYSVPTAPGQRSGGSSPLPSPDSLLRLVATIAGRGETVVGANAFRCLHQLLSARLATHSPGHGYASVPLLLDISAALLDALESSDRFGDLGVLISLDGGNQAAAIVLRCLGHIATAASSQLSNPDEFLGDSQAGVLLSKVVRALAGAADSRGDGSQTRTSLYAAFLVCGQLCQTKASDESIANAFGGRIGLRRTSGAEALVAAASEDAVSGPSAATRAAALVSLSIATQLDPLRVVPALSSQNRLRRVVSFALADSTSQAHIVRNCLHGGGDAENAPSEQSAVIVAESAVCLIHSVAGAVDGVRALSDAACLESVASLLGALSAPRNRAYAGDSENEELNSALRSRKSLRKGVRGAETMNPAALRFSEAQGSDMEFDEDDDEGDVSMLVEGRESPRERCAAVASVLSAAVAASVVGSDVILVDGALACLQAGEALYSRFIRGLDRPEKVYMSAVGHVAMILSRIPPHILSDGAVPATLRALIACHVGYLVPQGKPGVDIGSCRSPLSVGLTRAFPRTARDARRCQVEHPEGGSLFERDLVAARVECLKCVFASLRPPRGLLTCFVPRLSIPGPALDAEIRDSGKSVFVDEVSGRQGDLGDVFRVARAALDTMCHSSEESLRLASIVADETPSSMSARRLGELTPFCREELDLAEDEPVTGQVVLSCLQNAASMSRSQADSCVAILESALFVLREYTNAASEALRGNNYGANFGQDCPLSVREAELLISDGRGVLLQFCEDVDSLPGAVWGRQDSSFSRQLGRQIRTNLSSR